MKARRFLAAMIFLISACGNYELEIHAQIEPDPTLMVYNNQVFYALYGGADSTSTYEFADFLHTHSLIFAADSLADNPPQYRILIGDSGISDSGKAKKGIKGSGYLVKQDGDNLIIVGSNDTWTAMGLYALEDYLLNQSRQTTFGHRVIPEGFLLKEEYQDPQLIARLIQKGHAFALEPVFLLTCRGAGSCTVGQGATSDGRYIYVINRNSADDQCVIFRYDIRSLQWKGQSSIFNAGHANDLAYIPEKNQIVVSHGLKEGRVLTLVNASDLSVASNILIDVGSSSAAYSSVRGMLALSQGGTTLHFTDKDFNLIRSYKRKQSEGYTTQGMGCDDYYIYFPISSSKDNAIDVYNWDGDYITTLKINITKESETLFYAAGNYYVNFNSGGSSVYLIQPVLNYRFDDGDAL